MFLGSAAMPMRMGERKRYGVGRRLALLADTLLALAWSALPISRWVLNEACRQIRAWRDASLTPGRVAVNLSAAQCQGGHLAGLTGEDLELEITESTAMAHSLNLEAIAVGVEAAASPSTNRHATSEIA